MLRCQNCGTALPENARFCAQCGHALSVTMDTPTYSSNLIILPPSLSLSGDTISGGTLHLHGSRFFPGGMVVLTLDNGQMLTLVSPKGPVTVSGTGPFDVTMSGSENWSVGQHSIHARESRGGRNGVLSFTLKANHNVLKVASSSEGLVRWTALGNSPSILVNPQSGTMAPGQSQAVSVAWPANSCTDTSWSVKDSAGNIFTSKLICTPLG